MGREKADYGGIGGGDRLVTSGGSTPAWLMRRFVVAQDNWKVLQLLETKWVEGPSWKEARG